MRIELTPELRAFRDDLRQRFDRLITPRIPACRIMPRLTTCAFAWVSDSPV